MTYESQWKDVVDKEWAEYLATWNTAKPDEKPEKTRLIFLMEFMKEKLAAETDEMKEKVEEYRLSPKEETPAPIVTDQPDRAQNLKIQE